MGTGKLLTGRARLYLAPTDYLTMMGKYKVDLFSNKLKTYVGIHGSKKVFLFFETLS
jgi:hypothetical protein